MLTKTIKKSSAFIALFACVFALLPRTSDAFGYWGWRPYGWGWGGYRPWGGYGYGTIIIFFLDTKIKLTVSHKTNTRLARRLRMARRVLVRITIQKAIRLMIFIKTT